jgi:ferredoxin
LIGEEVGVLELGHVHPQIWCGRSYNRPVSFAVSIDQDVCMGSGNCVYAAPGVFDLDDDAIGFVVDSGGAPEDEVIAIAQRCPSRAITVERDGVKLV